MDGIYLIHSLTGNCLIFRKYGDLEFNEDLIAGFLTALKDFSSEVTGGKGTMKQLDMGDYSVLLIFNEGVVEKAGFVSSDISFKTPRQTFLY
jgi:hypothetical protein